MPHQNFINGNWVDAADGATDEVLNPATGAPIGAVTVGLNAEAF